MPSDPTFLQTILDYVDTRCRILRLYASTNVQVSNSIEPSLNYLLPGDSM